jgi:4-hydroxy-2-oxoheptanedioate aldolase
MTRVNKCIELLEQNQPIYSTSATALTYEAGFEQAKTWADLIIVEFEHHPFDTVGLRSFLLGLKDGGPTASGHLTPTVIATLPSNCITAEEITYNAWQSRHILSTGVHGLLQTHTRSPDAVRAFVATARYPLHTRGLKQGIPVGMRGAGGQGPPAEIWGLSQTDYVNKAEPWPLDPEGELMLGLKIEDRYALPDAKTIASVPGIAFAEWGPGDMSMSFGDPDGHNPPYSEEMTSALHTVRSACHQANIAFHCSWADPAMSVEEQVKYLLEKLDTKSLVVPNREHAAYGRTLTGRTMPV